MLVTKRNVYGTRGENWFLEKLKTHIHSIHGKEVENVSTYFQVFLIYQTSLWRMGMETWSCIVGISTHWSISYQHVLFKWNFQFIPKNNFFCLFSSKSWRVFIVNGTVDPCGKYLYNSQKTITSNPLQKNRYNFNHMSIVTTGYSGTAPPTSFTNKLVK